MTQKPKVLISDQLSPAAVKIFEDRGVDAQQKVGLSRDDLIAVIGSYDGLAIRSATKVTKDVLAAAKKLKVIGRAGIGVDNVDVPAASAKGIIVMNTPFGNSITTAEHAVAMMLALARQIPQAHISTAAGKWEKSRFMGVELTAKTLGIIGCGNIGSIVADRAHGLRMKVIAYDPFLSPERAADLGVEKVDLGQLLTRADIITLHTPLTDKTRNILNKDSLARTKKGVYIVNCARGGLIVEADLKKALESGQVAGAALDVFEKEPATANPLFGMDNVIFTPHLGASTTEAQENVALQVAEQMADYLLEGAVSNALNMPSITADEAPRLMPYVKLAEQLGQFAGQLTETGITDVTIEYEGSVAELNTRALTSAVLMGLMKPVLSEVNMVSAPMVAKERGINVSEVTRGQQGVFDSLMRLQVKTERQIRSVAGTVYSDKLPRVVEVNNINIEAEIGAHMLYVTNEDKPGFIGALGTTLGEAQINIGSFSLGRTAPNGDAVALIEVDTTIPKQVVEAVHRLPHVRDVKQLSF
jgi:D-3-phosphoglycerate dehydrogenase